MVFRESSHHPLEYVEYPDVVDGDEGGEVGRHVDPLQVGAAGVEGLKGLAPSHVPPLVQGRERQRERDTKVME